MPVNILMPALSPTMEKGNLARWLKKEGDKVKAGDVIAEIETDKATMEYEAIDDGVLAKVVVPEGTQDVAVNQLIAVLAQEGEDPKATAAAAGKGSASGAAKQAEALANKTAAVTPSPQPSSPRGEGAGSAASQVQRAPTAQAQQAPSPQAQRAPSPQGGEGWGEGSPANGQGTNRVFASPLARRLAKE